MLDESQPGVTMVGGEVVAALIMIRNDGPVTEEEGKLLMRVYEDQLWAAYSARHGREPDMATHRYVAGIRHPDMDWREIVHDPARIPEIEKMIAEAPPGAAVIPYVMKELPLLPGTYN